MLKIALGQFNAVVGDLHANAEKMRSLYDKAIAAGVDVVVFPELALCGYPPEDLLLKAHFVADNRVALETLAAKCPGLTMLVGFPESHLGKTYNAMAVLRDGQFRKSIASASCPITASLTSIAIFAAVASRSLLPYTITELLLLSAKMSGIPIGSPIFCSRSVRSTL